MAAGSSRLLESKYPILVRFDRGGGDQTVKKRVTQTNTALVVAVNPKDGLWDLYPERNFENVARKGNTQRSNLRQALMREKLRLALEGGE